MANTATQEIPGFSPQISKGEITDFHTSRAPGITQDPQPLDPAIGSTEKVTTPPSIETIFGSSNSRPSSQLDLKQVGLNKERILALALQK